jgi:hypothetical protein
MGAELNPAQRLHALGQSLWLDSINRVVLRTGALVHHVRELAVTGLTSNPTILGHAMAAGSDYDGSLARLADQGVPAPRIWCTPWRWRTWPRRRPCSARSGSNPGARTGMCRWRSHPMSPTTPPRRSRWPGGCTSRPASPTCWSRSPARRRA